MHTIKAMDEQQGLHHENDFDSEINCEHLTQTEQRSLIFHLLYAVDAYEYDISLNAVVDGFGRGFGVIIPQKSSVFKRAASVIADRDSLDAMIVPLIDEPRFERLGVATKLILRQSLWELLHCTIDSAVVINEAVELAKCFAEKDAYKFVNGVLDEYLKNHSQSTSSVQS